MSARRTRAIASPATSDAELMARLAEGEISALGELYDRHREAVHRFVTRATGGAHDVDDLVHVTFLTAAQCAGRYDGRASSKPWLLGIAVQLLKRRRSAFGRLVDVIASLGGARATSDDPRRALDVRSDVSRALARLTEAKRVTLLMAEVEGLSCPEIADALGIPVGTVWTRLHAARKEMRDAMEGAS